MFGSVGFHRKVDPEENLSDISSQPDCAWPTQFLLSQYQEVLGKQCSNHIQLEFLSREKSEVLETTIEFDNILEDFARNSNGYIQKSIGCSQCIDLQGNILFEKESSLGKVDIEDEHWVCDKRDHTLDAHEKETVTLLQQSGNFLNFKILLLNDDEITKTFFDESFKLTRTSCASKFQFRGRLSRYRDFDRISN